MIQDYQLMSKQLLQVDSMRYHRLLTQGPQKGHGCSESPCRSLPLSYNPPSGERGYY